MAGFTSKKVNYILRSAIQILCLMEYMRFVDDDSNWCVLVIVICFQFHTLVYCKDHRNPVEILI